MSLQKPPRLYICRSFSNNLETEQAQEGQEEVKNNHIIKDHEEDNIQDLNFEDDVTDYQYLNYQNIPDFVPSSPSSSSPSTEIMNISYNHKIEQLMEETNAILLSSTDHDNPKNITLELIQRWHTMILSLINDDDDLTSNLQQQQQQQRSSGKRERRNSNTELQKRQNNMKLKCATQMEELLQHYITNLNSSSSPSSAGGGGNDDDDDTPLPFSLTMDAWRQSTSPNAGSKAADILDQWGELYGGDMNYAPSIREFNIVLDSYARSSSGDYNYFYNERKKKKRNNNNSSRGEGSNSDDSSSSSTTSIMLPAESAWDIYTFLSQLNDIFLQPNIITCSNVIHALKHHAFVMNYSSSNTTTASDSKTENCMDSDIAAVRAYAVWKQMMKLMETYNPSSSSLSSSLSSVTKSGCYEEDDIMVQKLLWRANLDVLSLSANGLLRRRNEVVEKGHDVDGGNTNVGKSTEELLVKMLNYMNSNKSSIDGGGVVDEGEEEVIMWNNAAITRSHLRSAYLSTMVAWTKEQEFILDHVKKSRIDPNGNDDDLILHIYEAAVSVESLLDQLKETTGISPQSAHYNASIHAYANCLDDTILGHAKPDGTIASKCITLLEDMEKEYDYDILLLDDDGGSTDGDNEKMLWAATYRRTLRTLMQSVKNAGGGLNSRVLSTGDKAEKILERMIDLFLNGKLSMDNPRGLTYAFNYVLLIYSQCEGSRRAVERSKALFRRLLKFQEEQIERGCDSRFHTAHPDGVTYGAILTTLSRSNVKDSGSVAFEVMRQLQTSNVRPNIAHYTAAIKAMATDPASHLVLRTHDLFDEADEAYRNLSDEEKEYSDYNPSALCSAMVSGWFQQGRKRAGADGVKLLERLEGNYDETLDERFKPDIILYSTVLNALSNQRDKEYTSIATGILEKMDVMLENNERDFAQNKASYTTLINALSRSNIQDSAERSEKLVQRMESQYQQSGDENLKPDSLVYNSLINAWSNSADMNAVVKAEDVLNTMENKAMNGDFQAQPTLLTYTSLIKCWWKSGRNDCGEKAEEVLNRLEEKVASGDIQKIDAFPYTCAINAWGRSPSSSKAERAWGVIQKMKHSCENGNLSAKPNVFSLTAVLNVCAHLPKSSDEKDRREALNIALQASSMLIEGNGEYGKANNVYFRALLKVFGELIQSREERCRFATVAFKRCCEMGQVDEHVLTMLKRYTPSVYSELCLNGETKSRTIEIPYEWSKNIKKSFKKKKMKRV